MAAIPNGENDDYGDANLCVDDVYVLPTDEPQQHPAPAPCEVTAARPRPSTRPRPSARPGFEPSGAVSEVPEPAPTDDGPNTAEAQGPVPYWLEAEAAGAVAQDGYAILEDDAAADTEPDEDVDVEPHDALTASILEMLAYADAEGKPVCQGATGELEDEGGAGAPEAGGGLDGQPSAGSAGTAGDAELGAKGVSSAEGDAEPAGEAGPGGSSGMQVDSAAAPVAPPEAPPLSQCKQGNGERHASPMPGGDEDGAGGRGVAMHEEDDDDDVDFPTEHPVGVADVAAMDEDEDEALDLDARATELARVLASSVCGEVGLSYRALIKHLSVHTRDLADADGTNAEPRGAPVQQHEDAAATSAGVAQPTAAADPASASALHQGQGMLFAPLPREPVSVKIKAPCTKKFPAKARPKTSAKLTQGGPAPVVVLDDHDHEPEQVHRQPLNCQEDPYASRAAPLVLLRAYASQERWIDVRNGFIAFEDDGVQYPLATPTPVRQDLECATLLNLASLYLVVALRDHYDSTATPEVCGRHGAVRIASQHLDGLIAYLFGVCDQCPLLVTSAVALTAVPRPEPVRMPLRTAGVPIPSPPMQDGLEALRRRLAAGSQ